MVFESKELNWVDNRTRSENHLAEFRSFGFNLCGNLISIIKFFLKRSCSVSNYVLKLIKFTS